MNIFPRFKFCMVQVSDALAALSADIAGNMESISEYRDIVKKTADLEKKIQTMLHARVPSDDLEQGASSSPYAVDPDSGTSSTAAANIVDNFSLHFVTQHYTKETALNKIAQLRLQQIDTLSELRLLNSLLQFTGTTYELLWKLVEGVQHNANPPGVALQELMTNRTGIYQVIWFNLLNN
jgi:hypothetical protein